MSSYRGKHFKKLLLRAVANRVKVDQCEDKPLLAVLKKCSVEILPEPTQDKWRALGGQEPSKQRKDDGVSFWSRLWYDSENARFEYPKALPKCPSDEDEITWCRMCKVCKENKQRWEPMLGDEIEEGVGYSSLTWDRAPLKPGDAVYLAPESVKLKIKKKVKTKEAVIKDLADVDKDLYPEYYRKRGNLKGSNVETPDPFQIAVIKSITDSLGSVRLKIQLFHRPEDTHRGPKAAEGSCYNKVGIHPTKKEGLIRKIGFFFENLENIFSQ